MSGARKAQGIDQSEKRIAGFSIENDQLTVTILSGRAVETDHGLHFRYERAYEPQTKRLRTSLDADDLRENARALLARFPDGRLDAIGISSYGAIDTSNGIFRDTPSDEPALENPSYFDFPAVLKPVTGSVPILIENDATAAAVGEYWWGAGKAGVHYKPRSAFAYVWISRGVNAGVVLDGIPLGVRFRPETGHLKAHHFEKDGMADPIIKGSCTKHDFCITGMAGLKTMLARLAAPSIDEETAIRITADYIAQLCATMSLTVAPAQIVLGGLQMGMPWAERLFAHVKDQYRFHSVAFPFRPVDETFNETIVKAELGSQAALLGAAECARRMHIADIEAEIAR